MSDTSEVKETPPFVTHHTVSVAVKHFGATPTAAAVSTYCHSHFRGAITVTTPPPEPRSKPGALVSLIDCYLV
jgi:hypothetical protein